MKNLLVYESYSDFGTEIVNTIFDVEEGDEIFHLGVWKVADKVNLDSITLYDPTKRAYLIVRQKDLDRTPLLKKI
jgi:hypothetical protein